MPSARLDAPNPSAEAVCDALCADMKLSGRWRRRGRVYAGLCIWAAVAAAGILQSGVVLASGCGPELWIGGVCWRCYFARPRVVPNILKGSVYVGINTK